MGVFWVRSTRENQLLLILAPKMNIFVTCKETH